jgi:hypothetical protein
MLSISESGNGVSLAVKHVESTLRVSPRERDFFSTHIRGRRHPHVIEVQESAYWH